MAGKRLTTDTLTQILERVKDECDAHIDDNAGIGDVTKAWSADKNAKEIGALKSAINVLEDAVEAVHEVPAGGTSGQILTKVSGSDYDVQWSPVGMPSDAQVDEAVSDWLDDHPEATTTVEDGSITKVKLNSSLAEEIDDKAPIIKVSKTGRYSDLSDVVTAENSGLSSVTVEGLGINHLIAFNSENLFGDLREYTPASGSGFDVELTKDSVKISGTYANTITLNPVKKDLKQSIPAGTKINIAALYTGSSTGYNELTCQLRVTFYDTNGDYIDYWPVRFFGSEVLRTFTMNKDVAKVTIQIQGVTGWTCNNLEVYPMMFTGEDYIQVDQVISAGSDYSLDVSIINDWNKITTTPYVHEIQYNADTKAYVDSHIPSNVVTTETLEDYVPNEKNLVYVTPEMFGAVGDASADDSTALQDAIDYAALNNIAMRAFGHYRTLSPIVLESEHANIYIHDIDYRGTGGAAFVLHGEYNYIHIDRLYAYFSTGAALKMETTSDIDLCYNELHLGAVYGNTNGIECYNNYGSSETGNRHFYYNKIYMQRLYSSTANGVYLSANLQMNENSFWGKYVACGNGYCVYCDGTGANSTTNRFYEFCIESGCKNGVYGIAQLINCRTDELFGRKTAIDDDKGYIFTFDSVLPLGYAINTKVLYTGVDVSNARSYEDSILYAKTSYESENITSTTAFDRAFPDRNTHIIGHGSSLMSYMQNAMEGDYTQSGSVFAYFNHKGFIPDYDWYYEVDTSDYYTFTTDHCIPTIFDIKATTTIHLDDSYCPIGIKRVKVIQTATEKATIYDHNNVLVFNGSTLDAGTYILCCELLDPDPITIVTSKGTITRKSSELRGTYTGTNEKWTVEKLNIVS